MAAAPRALLLAILSLPACLLSCGGGSSGGSFTPTTYTLSVSPQPASVAVGSTVTFTATTNAPSVSWVLVGVYANDPPNFAGSPETQAGGATFVYTAPSTPPVYPTNIEAAGTVTVRAIASTTVVQTTFTITAPSITTGFYSPVSTSVPLGTTLIINAYAVGSINNALTLEVNGTAGGSASVGTIAPVTNGLYGEYQYTAPAAMPMTGSTITLTVISQADPTKFSTLTLTLH